MYFLDLVLHFLRLFLLKYFIFILFFLPSSKLYSNNSESSQRIKNISCKDVRILMKDFIKTHLKYYKNTNTSERNREISQRTWKKYLDFWDFEKIYFLQDDIESFLDPKSRITVDNLIPMNFPNSLGGFGDLRCSIIANVYATFRENFNYILKNKIDLWISSVKNFEKDESINVDYKNRGFSRTRKEQEERWRKKIKLELLRLKEITEDIVIAKKKLKKRYILLQKHYESFLDKNKAKSDMTQEAYVFGIWLKMFASSLDPHTNYLTAHEMAEFRIAMNVSLDGIGALLQNEDGVTSIKKLIPGGAAIEVVINKEYGAIKSGDTIIQVGEDKNEMIDVIGWEIGKVVRRIRGKRGTPVCLKLKRKKTALPVVCMNRKKIELQDRRAKSYSYYFPSHLHKNRKINVQNKYHIGVISLPSFYRNFSAKSQSSVDYVSSAKDVSKEITRLKKASVDAIILDLRNNGGGSLDEAVQLSGLFIGEGPMVQVESRRSGLFSKGTSMEPLLYKGSPLFTEKPLFVLVSKQSASASEILAGAIQDYKRGLIVGDEHTFGKGSVQNLIDKSREGFGGMKVTIMGFFRPSGKTTQKHGVSSDILLPSLLNHYELGEKHYDYALDLQDKPAANNFSNKRFTQQTLKNKTCLNTKQQLIAMSQKRRIEKTKFVELSKEIEEFKKTQKNKYTISLKDKKDSENKKKNKENSKNIQEKNTSKSQSEKKDLQNSEEEKPSLEGDIILGEALDIMVDCLDIKFHPAKVLGQIP